MSKWINRSVLSGGSVSQNGTNSHTCTFTAAAAGNYLVAVIAGGVTSTTPAGWTMLVSAINNCGLYIFGKIAVANESSFSTTHNGSNYAISGIVYEYPSGTTWVGGGYDALVVGSGSKTGPTVSGLSGTYTELAARSHAISTLSGSIDVTWTTPSIEDYEVSVGGAQGNDGVGLSVAYQDNAVGSSYTASYTMAWQGAAANQGECVAIALSVPAVNTSVNLLRTGSITPTSLYVGTMPVARVYAGSTLVYGVGADGDDSMGGTPSLYMSPQTGDFNIGDTIQVQVRMDSGSLAVNTVQADIVYPASLLSYQTVSHAGAPFTTAIQEQNSGDTLRIGVGILNGSASGDQLVATITFMALAAGSVTLAFAGTSGIADYASSADVLNTTIGVSYAIS